MSAAVRASMAAADFYEAQGRKFKRQLQEASDKFEAEKKQRFESAVDRKAEGENGSFPK